MDSLLSKYRKGFKNGYFIRVGDISHNMFIGKDDEGRFCFEFRGIFKPVKLIGSKPLLVNQYKTSTDALILRFALEQYDLLGCFAAFGEDLIVSVDNLKDDEAIYKVLTDRYQAWKKLFKPDRAKLTEPEIMGLLGELLFLKEKAIPMWGASTALESWTGPEKTHKDFSNEASWYEIKAINSGKESVHISSIEQLDSNVNGYLYIFSFEKMSPSFEGLSLNFVVHQILCNLTSSQKEVFLNKLLYFGFDFAPYLDSYIFRQTDEFCYIVNNDFPRLKRGTLSLAISKAQYDILLPEIEPFKTNLMN